MAHAAGWHVLPHDRLNVTRTVFKHFTHAKDHILDKLDDLLNAEDDFCKAEKIYNAVLLVHTWQEGEHAATANDQTFYIEPLPLPDLAEQLRRTTRWHQIKNR